MTTSSSASSVRAAAVERVLGAELLQKLASAKVLVVGAGGIGCELLKNLALSGFQNIEVVDLDTIDVSNLNRQFLFRRQHVSMSKAKVAREAVLQFNPGVNITARHGNIKDAEFGPDYFSRFSIVMNALDNLEARRHVNRICVAKDITLIESGTQGYIGQTTVIRKDVTACFECSPKTTPKSFAICTIRNTPDKPVHCVVWAKHVFGVLFGPDDEGNLLADLKATLANDDAAETLLRKLFVDDVNESRAIATRWQKRRAPVPLDLERLQKQQQKQHESSVARDQTVLTDAENVVAFTRAWERMRSERRDEIGSVSFDKDDELAMEMVSCLANLRMAVYHIETISSFAVKGIAGNIVHAIATTNAIAAGLIVLEAIKVLNDEFSRCRTVWVKRTGPKVLQPQQLEGPNPTCYVCRKNTLTLRLNTNTFTLSRLFRQILIGRLGMNEPSIDVGNRSNFVGSEDDHDAEYLARTLDDKGVRINDGAMLSVDDLSQSFECDIIVSHTDDIDRDEVPAEFELSGELSRSSDTAATEREMPPAKRRKTESESVGVVDDDVIEVDGAVANA